MHPVGIIGLGLLGSALAERLLGQGYPIMGYDLVPERREALRSAGGVPADDPRALPRECQTILLALPTSDIVDGVLEELRPELRPGHAIIDTTTGAPEAAAQRGAVWDRRGVACLDATVLGSSAEARRGEVLLMVGGSAAAVAQSRPILAACSHQVFHVGSCGAGARMKLVVNLVLGLQRAVLAEGLGLARAQGLDLECTLEVLRAGAAYSRVMDSKGPKMLAHDFTPVARLAQHLKDVRLILDAGAQTGARLPLSQLHAGLLEELVGRGFGACDNSAIWEAFTPQDAPRHPPQGRDSGPV